ncbi:hypothetical protein [Breoghania sp.]|uniref:hypothetical protein n=1 Tax=Breoghania sp. TaxID=2065378 RepID=UPI0026171B04|nr:hypothetical protein [Breoghania sp.]MDJ0931285.1 hypothetical protein [Breoghania sp.]
MLPHHTIAEPPAGSRYDRTAVQKASSINWTNTSVKAFEKNADPLAVIEDAAYSLVLKAREQGWEGPPFNPLRIAEMLEVQIEANSGVADGTIGGDGKRSEDRVQSSAAAGAGAVLNCPRNSALSFS